ncbi:Bug family tripartite tricarboxylate transporter substrate binding protein [Salipiger marinus]|jgi:putative tricarboxylic transport membrane protein|uniref:Bug family tripartite tricarboxylate transporter substrate binding protein n=1 Tax=Salipiger marinus TaxID=555512 RepID=UPI000E8642D1|nr:tripartite tricarboxylate transporter substrate-binding protein [Salipiger manganoxidans]MEB3418583.1 tripartite tricarboxylate transporter substrate-binding protein [Salipiger manganoxidans]HBM59760.1 C4-dicarboxylate ABC transporter substrate-binding protein [Citreicella sp.]HBT00743.1 C4-dicarboxylate ABC transporter substrate-binding protein [Citreicella sp.]
MSITRKLVTGAIFATGLTAISAVTASAAECIAPADPGGGWDFTCRTVGRLLTDLGIEDSSVQVTNMPGGVGAVAFANVAGKRASEGELLVATSTVGVTQIAQGKYPGGVDVMRWVGMLGTDVGVITVPADSEYDSIDDLLDALKADPTSIPVAGSSGAGGWDHIRLLMLADAAGMSGEDYKAIRWVQFDGGSPAVTQMLGGQVGAVSTDLGEIAGFVESGDIKILAALSDEPIPAFPDAPTAKAQGYDVTGYNWRGFYTGGDVSDAEYQAWVDKLKALYDTAEWKEAAEGNGLITVWRGGDEFETYVAEQAQQMEEISRSIGVIQ